MRTVLIVGLVLLAALLPLAALPLVIAFVLTSVFNVVVITHYISRSEQPVALLSLTSFRAPPSL